MLSVTVWSYVFGYHVRASSFTGVRVPESKRLRFWRANTGKVKLDAFVEESDKLRLADVIGIATEPFTIGIDRNRLSITMNLGAINATRGYHECW